MLPTQFHPMDKLSPQQRHANMAAIHGKDTKPEMVVRKWLWRNGFRYRLNHPRLPGKPDIVMRKYRTCIFVNGCFWHGHNVAWMPTEAAECVADPLQDDSREPNDQTTREPNDQTTKSSECCRIPRTNTEFWTEKIRRNKERDRRVQQQLATMGWHCITIWECELKPMVREKTLEALAYTLNSIFLQDHRIRRQYVLPEEEPMMAAEDRKV